MRHRGGLWLWMVAGASLLWLTGCRRHAGLPLAKPPSPVSLALHGLADQAHERELRWPNFADLKKPVEGFYSAHQYEPVWLKGSKPTEQARQMMAAFAACATDGLDPEDYDSSHWAQFAAGIHDDRDRGAFDMALTVDAMRYMNDEHNGRVSPKRFNFGIDVTQKRYDLAQFLTDKIITSRNVGAVLNSVAPQSEEYRRALAAYRHYVELARQDAGGGLPLPAHQLRPGDAYAGGARLRLLLMLYGYLPGDAAETAAGRYDPALARAVKRFQFHHGLTADGKMGPPTIAALNVPTAQRAHQLAIALERWRWLPDAYQDAPIFVNLPEYKLRIYSNLPFPPPDDAAEGDTQKGTVPPAVDPHDHTKIALEMNVVTGKAGILAPKKPGEVPEDHQTPMLANQMRYLIFRPYWSVPIDITQRELLPHMETDPTYLAAHGFEVVDHRQKPVLYRNADETKLLHGQLMVRQAAGDENSLGLVKFMFPNPYSIYLHSTPAVGLFARTRRDFSHGCVRVQQPVQLAQWVLRDRAEWDQDKIEEAMKDGDDNKTVPLKKPIPVVIFYDTAYVEPDGTIDFTQDIYGYDRLLDETLAEGRPYPTKPLVPVVDVHDER